MRLKWIAMAALAATLGTAHAAIKEQPVTYSDGSTTMKGFVVYDDARSGKRPGIVVVHEWWGITPHVRAEARDLASQGYTAFVADMYGDGKTADNPQDASLLSGEVRTDPALMQARFNAARQELAKQPTVNPDRIGAVGFCFGGAVVLDMARTGSDLAGVAAFHPGLDPAGERAEPGKVKSKVLVLTGSADPFVKPESIDAFKGEMSAAKVSYRYITYPGALHAFTNPDATALGKKFNIGIKYDADADKKSKAEAKKFLAEVFGK
jgi:dienelactone hydrolase